MIEQRPHRRGLFSWAHSAHVRVGAAVACGALVLLLSSAQWVQATGPSSIVNRIGAMRIQTWVVAAELADHTGLPKRRSERARRAVDDSDHRLNDPEWHQLLATDRDTAKPQTLRSIASDWDQRPRPLAVDGIAFVPAREAYRSHAPAFASSVNDVVDLAERRLERPVQGHVLPIVREALSRVDKHARATAVKLQLVSNRTADVPGETHSRPAVEIVIEDDGVGARLTESPFGHFGLNIMRDRVAMIGGSFAIERRSIRSSSVRLRFPGAAAAAHAPNDAVSAFSQHRG